MGKPLHLSPEAIRVGITSPDERTRAVAVRSACVCHGDWSVFRELLPVLRGARRTALERAFCIGMIGAVRALGIAADARYVGAFDEAQG